MTIFRLAHPLRSEVNLRFVLVEERGVRVRVKNVATGQPCVLMRRDLEVEAEICFLGPDHRLELLLLSLGLVPESFEKVDEAGTLVPVLWTAEHRLMIGIMPEGYALQVEDGGGTFEGGTVANLNELEKTLKKIMQTLK